MNQKLKIADENTGDEKCSAFGPWKRSFFSTFPLIKMYTLNGEMENVIPVVTATPHVG